VAPIHQACLSLSAGFNAPSAMVWGSSTSGGSSGAPCSSGGAREAVEVGRRWQRLIEESGSRFFAQGGSSGKAVA
jgi:hypothetical protein